MTKKAQEAYARGFCKVAEANGVNSESLYKYAVMALRPDIAQLLTLAGAPIVGAAAGKLSQEHGGNRFHNAVTGAATGALAGGALNALNTRALAKLWTGGGPLSAEAKMAVLASLGIGGALGGTMGLTGGLFGKKKTLWEKVKSKLGA